MNFQPPAGVEKLSIKKKVVNVVGGDGGIQNDGPKDASAKR